MGGYIYVFYICIYIWFIYLFAYVYTYLHLYLHIHFILMITLACTYAFMYILHYHLIPRQRVPSAWSDFFFWKPQVALQGFVPREWWGDGMKPSWAICGCWNGDLEYLEFVMYVYLYIYILHICLKEIYRITGSCSCVCWLVCLSADHVDANVFFISTWFLVASYIETLVDILISTICCLHVFFIFLHVLFVQSLHTCILHTSPWFCCTFDQIWGLCIRYISFNRAYLWGYLEFNWFQQWQIQFSKFLVQFNSLLNYSHHSEQRYDDQAANYTPWN